MKRMLMVLCMLSLLLLSACSVPVEKACEVDSDCVAAVCCHADDVVNADYAPVCVDILCSASCEPGTLDCGQAVPKCVKNECVLVAVEE